MVDVTSSQTRPGRNFSWGAHDAGHALAAIPGGSLRAPQRQGTAAILPLDPPRPIVAGEDDIGVVINAKALQRVEQAAGVEINFLHHVAVETARGFPQKILRRRQFGMRHRVSQIDEERLRAMLRDELDCLVGITPSQRRHGRIGFNHLLIAQQVDAFVVARRRAEKVIEALLVGHQRRIEIGLRVSRHVPLAEGCGGVAERFEYLRDHELPQVNIKMQVHPVFSFSRPAAGSSRSSKPSATARRLAARKSW